MNEILCSTGALIGRPNGRNHRLLEEFVPQLNCDGFEFMMYDTWYEKADEVVADLQAMKLHIPVMHCEKRIGEAISLGKTEEAFRLFRANCEIAQRLGPATWSFTVEIYLSSTLQHLQFFSYDGKSYEGQPRSMIRSKETDLSTSKYPDPGLSSLPT